MRWRPAVRVRESYLQPTGTSFLGDESKNVRGFAHRSFDEEEEEEGEGGETLQISIFA